MVSFHVSSLGRLWPAPIASLCRAQTAYNVHVALEPVSLAHPSSALATRLLQGRISQACAAEVGVSADGGVQCTCVFSRQGKYPNP